jgi:actin-related protein
MVDCYSAEAARAALSAPPLAAGAGLAGAVAEAIASTDLVCRREVAARLLVAGGVSAVPGLEARLQRDMQASLSPFAAAVSVMSHPHPQESAWLGGAALASLSSFGSICTDREAFYELREDALRRTCQIG